VPRDVLDAAEGDARGGAARFAILGHDGVEIAEHAGDPQQLFGMSATAQHGVATFLSIDWIPSNR